MTKKSGIELKLTYGTWNCMAPKKYKSLSHALKQNIRKTVLNGCFDEYSRELPAVVNAPFMNLDTSKQTPFIKVDLNEKRIKTHKINDGLEINYDGRIDVTMCWRVKTW